MPQIIRHSEDNAQSPPIWYLIRWQLLQLFSTREWLCSAEWTIFQAAWSKQMCHSALAAEVENQANNSETYDCYN